MPSHSPLPYETAITIPGRVGNIEARVATPAADATSPLPLTLAIVCHPHPLYGGAMDNKVVTTLNRAFRDLGMHTLRFNYRGVGASDGEFGEGVGETDDLLSVLAWATEQYPDLQIGLAGFSFGSYVAANAAGQMIPQPRFLITVAPAVNHQDFSALKPIPCPWLVIQGDEDEIVPVDAVRAFVNASADAPNPPELTLFDNCGHFFHGKLAELRETVENKTRAFLQC